MIRRGLVLVAAAATVFGMSAAPLAQAAGSLSVTVLPPSNLRPGADDTIDFTFEFENNGSEDLTDLVLTANQILTSDGVAGTPWDVSSFFTCDTPDGKVPAELPAGKKLTCTDTEFAYPQYFDRGDENLLTVEGTLTGLDTSKQSVTVPFASGPSLLSKITDLEVKATQSPATLSASGDVTVHYTLKNTGSNPMTAVQISWNMFYATDDQGVVFWSSDRTNDPGVVTCAASTLAVGVSTECEVTVSVPQSAFNGATKVGAAVQAQYVDMNTTTVTTWYVDADPWTKLVLDPQTVLPDNVAAPTGGSVAGNNGTPALLIGMMFMLAGVVVFGSRKLVELNK